MRGRSAALLAAAIAATGLFAKAAKADIVVNTFDDSDSAAEVSQWNFDYGIGAFTSSDATLSFSTDDAGNSNTSGSLDIKYNFNNAGGDEGAAVTRYGLGGFDASAAGVLTLDADVKIVSGSAADQFGQSGYMQLVHRNGNNYDFEGDFADNLRASDGWRHISVPLVSPKNAINALTMQLYDNGAASQFPGPNGLVDLRLDNVKFVTTPPPPPPPGVLRAGHQFSFESASEIDSTHNGGQTTKTFAFGDSYDGNFVDHTQSTLFPTDGAHSMRLSQPLNTFHVGTAVLYNNTNPTLFNGLAQGTKLLVDITTPAHGPSYQTLEARLNFGNPGTDGTGPTHEVGSYSGNFYQFVDGNPGGDTTRTTAATQTYTWDYGGQMEFLNGQKFPDLTNYNFIEFATGNGGAAAGDAQPDATSEYFLDNVRVVNEDTSTRPTWQTTSTADWTSGNWANGVPNGVAAPAIFDGIGAGNGTTAANATVTVSSVITVGSIIFDSQMTNFQFAGASNSITSADQLPQTVNYTLSGGGTLTLDSGTNTSEIYAIAGSHTIAVPVQVKSNLEIDTSAGFAADGNTSLPGGGRFSHVAMTSLAFNSPITLADKATLTTHGAGTVSFAAISPASGANTGLVINGGHANLNGNVTVGSFAIAAAGKATVTAGGSTVVRTGSLQMLGGMLDLTNNKMIVDYSGTSPIMDIQSALASGFNGGAWNGAGIVSSNAAASTSVKTAIGYGDAATLHITNFGGQGVTSAVLLEYTLAGDANLDGKVNLLDLNAVATNFGGSNKVWTDGDTTYDGTVNIRDFNALALNFGQTAPSSAAPLGALVPEPSSCVLLTAIGIASSRLRRRKTR